jgi:hypothetical protein
LKTAGERPTFTGSMPPKPNGFAGYGENNGITASRVLSGSRSVQLGDQRSTGTWQEGPRTG